MKKPSSTLPFRPALLIQITLLAFLGAASQSCVPKLPDCAWGEALCLFSGLLSGKTCPFMSWYSRTSSRQQAIVVLDCHYSCLRLFAALNSILYRFQYHYAAVSGTGDSIDLKSLGFDHFIRDHLSRFSLPM